MDSDYQCLLDFACESDGGLSQVSSLRLAERVVEDFFNLGMSYEDILERIMHSAYYSRLLNYFVELARAQGKETEAVCAMIASNDREWMKDLFIPVFLNLQLPPKTVRKLLKEQRDVFIDPEHLLFDALNMDAYYVERIRHYIRGKNLLRAYDELQKGWKGYLQKSADPFDECWSEYCLKMSRATFRQMTHELFEALVAKGFCEALHPQESYLRKSEEIRCFQITVYEQKPHSKNQNTPRTYQTTTRHPGANMAEEFILERARQENDFHYRFSPEGEMVLRMAEWATRQKQEKKRKRQKRRMRT